MTDEVDIFIFCQEIKIRLMYFVYILTNMRKTVLYVGVTNDLRRRLDEHIQNSGNPKTFAGRYYCHRLLFWEEYNDVNVAIEREKQIKSWRRQKKVDLIKSVNPNWEFMNDRIV